MPVRGRRIYVCDVVFQRKGTERRWGIDSIELAVIDHRAMKRLSEYEKELAAGRTGRLRLHKFEQLVGCNPIECVMGLFVFKEKVRLPVNGGSIFPGGFREKSIVVSQVSSPRYDAILIVKVYHPRIGEAHENYLFIVLGE